MRLMTVAIAFAALTPTLGQAQTQATTQAAITSAMIEACYVKNSGTIYRINASNTPTKCSINGTPFSWNIQGPQGETGPAGPQGTQGPAGPAGANGLAGYHIVEWQVPIQTGNGLIRAWCNADEVVLGGGHFVWEASDLPVKFSRPIMLLGENAGWEVQVKNPYAQSVAVRAYAICVKNPT